MKSDDLVLGRFVLVKETKEGPDVGIISMIWQNSVDITILGYDVWYESDQMALVTNISKDNQDKIIKIFPENYSYQDCLNEKD